MPSRYTLVTALLFCLVLARPDGAHADDDNLTFDQAQTRTSFARDRMETAERELRRLERKEKFAYESLSAAQKRYDEAKTEADQATRLREAAEAIAAETRIRWEQESARLQRIHRENEARRRSR